MTFKGVLWSNMSLGSINRGCHFSHGRLLEAHLPVLAVLLLLCLCFELASMRVWFELYMAVGMSVVLLLSLKKDMNSAL